MERKLVTVQRISSIDDIFDENGQRANVIAQISFEDIAWKCVCKREEFNVGDLCVYIEVSSVVPDVPCFSFMAKRHFLVGTARFLKTTYSHGLALPVSILSDFGYDGAIEQGMNLTDIIGVTPKPEPINFGKDQVAHNFPVDIIPKTDEMRLQSEIGVLAEMHGLPAVAREKIDGASLTALMRDGELVVCSRNYELKNREDSNYWQAVIRDGIGKVIEESGGRYVIQGELAGEGVSPNRTKIKGLPHVYVYNIYDTTERRYLTDDELADECDYYALYRPRIIKEWMSFDATLEELEELARGPSFHDPNQQREGIVIRPTERNIRSRTLGGLLSFKVVSDSFALKNEE